jgi:hypothetical protein
MDRLVFPDGSDFARSSNEFLEHRGDDARTTRVYVKVAGGADQPSVLFAIDTGAEISFCTDRARLQSWNVHDEELYAKAPGGKGFRYLVRDHLIPCDRGTVELRLLADKGPDLVVCIRIAYPTVDVVLPTESGLAVLGYRGGLDRIRFAVSPPPDSRWYFDHAA